MIKIEMLRCFSVVARSGNLADAATRLGRTQSAISMTLKQLEDALGQKLFQGERKNHLTPVGVQILALAQQQVESFDTAIRDIEATARAPRGLLRIISVPSAAGSLVPHVAEDLLARYPGLQIDIRDGETEAVLNALGRGEADLGIVSGEHALRGVVSAPLFEDAFGLTCARDHPLADRDGDLCFADTAGFDIVGNTLCRALDHDGLQAAIAATALHAHNTLSLIGILQQGARFTILPRAVVANLPGRLSFRPLQDLPARRSVSVLISERASQREIAEECAAMLQVLCRQDGSP
ncbi:LysR family transcriptional regulator [Dinoroseobacter sp. S375]|uniref:LysR family transcriptional regulator n=1 Tax=Dinoroseobacter sp. S375 TaxID=3415136 RepID=UPI003C7BF83D